MVYSRLRVLLHWLSAAVIIWTLVSGFYVANFETTAFIRNTVSSINVSITTVFIPFFVLRLFLFIIQCRQLSFGTWKLMEKLAFFAHTLIYVTVSIVLVTGVLMMSRPISVFALFELAQPLVDPGLIAFFVVVHIASCAFLALLVLLHIGAVIIHEAQGHGVLKRMSWNSRTRRLDDSSKP